MKYVILLVLACFVFSLSAMGCDEHRRRHRSLTPTEPVAERPA
ncbi:MAG: hypothetical protein NTU94_09720 [Planctomycetota bacterium]|nr:hypothetical protein [Planctomycetota bacterium]